MSVDVCLKQRGVFKKPLPLSFITNNNQLAYGTLNSWILQPDVISDDMVLYDREQIGRGISLVWDEKNPKQVELRLLLPTTRHEIDVFYDLIQRIAQHWNLRKYEQDGIEQKVSAMEEMRENINVFSKECLRDFLAKHDSGCFFSALHPLYYDEQDLEEMQINFAAFLHHRQSMDVYYARPRIYQRADGEFFGVYTLTNGVDTVLPLEPMAPFQMRNPNTDEDLVVKEWYLAMYYYEEERFLGQLPYEKACAVLRLASQERYDAKTRLLYGVDVAQMQEIITAYGVDV